MPFLQRVKSRKRISAFNALTDPNVIQLGLVQGQTPYAIIKDDDQAYIVDHKASVTRRGQVADYNQPGRAFSFNGIDDSLTCPVAASHVSYRDTAGAWTGPVAVVGNALTPVATLDAFDIKFWSDGTATAVQVQATDIATAGVNLVAWYADGDAAATDSSGNVNDGAFTGTITEHSVYSFANQGIISGNGRVGHDLPLKSPVITANGIDNAIEFPTGYLVGVTIVSSQGTSTPTINGDQIDLTGGTIWDLLLSDGTLLQMDECAGKILHNANANANHGLWKGADPDWSARSEFQSPRIVNEGWLRSVEYPSNSARAVLTYDGAMADMNGAWRAEMWFREQTLAGSYGMVMGGISVNISNTQMFIAGTGAVPFTAFPGANAPGDPISHIVFEHDGAGNFTATANGASETKAVAYTPTTGWAAIGGTGSAGSGQRIDDVVYEGIFTIGGTEYRTSQSTKMVSSGTIADMNATVRSWLKGMPKAAADAIGQPISHGPGVIHSGHEYNHARVANIPELVAGLVGTPATQTVDDVGAAPHLAFDDDITSTKVAASLDGSLPDPTYWTAQ